MKGTTESDCIGEADVGDFKDCQLIDALQTVITAVK